MTATVQGTIQAIDLGTVLTWIAQQQWTGELTLMPPIQGLEETSPLLRFWFTTGKLTYGGPVGQADRDRSQDYGLTPWLDTSLPPGYSGLWRAISSEAIPWPQVRSLWRGMISEALFEGFSYRQGAFAFVPTPPLIPSFGGWAVAPLRMEVMCQRQAWLRLAPRIKSVAQCPHILDLAAAQAALAHTSYGAIALWADGHTSLAQLARRLGGDLLTLAHWVEVGCQQGWLLLPPLAPTPTPASPPSLLYIGDDPQLSQPTALALQAEGYEVCVEANPFIALSYICDTLPDLILCDALFPTLKGATLAAMIRQLPRGDRPPIFLLQDESPPPMDFPPPVTLILTKPCQTSTLLKLLPQHLAAEKRPKNSTEPIMIGKIPVQRELNNR